MSEILSRFNDYICSEINEYNMIEFLTFIYTERENKELFKFTDQNIEWLTVLLNIEQGVDYYVRGYFYLDECSIVTTLIKYSNLYEYYVQSLGIDINIIFYTACNLHNIKVCEYVYNLYNNVIFHKYTEPLFSTAIRSGFSKEILDFLHNRNENLYKEKNNYGQSPIIYSVIFPNIDVFKYLISIDPTIYKTEKIDNKSIFYYACINNYTKIIKYLLSIDSYIYKEENDKDELLSKLFEINYLNKYDEILELLLAFSD